MEQMNLDYTQLIVFFLTFITGSFSTLLVWIVQKKNIYKDKIIENQIIAYKQLNAVLIDIEYVIENSDDNDGIRIAVIELINRFKKENQIFINEQLFQKFDNYFKWFIERNINYKSEANKVISAIRIELNKQLRQRLGHR